MTVKIIEDATFEKRQPLALVSQIFGQLGVALAVCNHPY